MGSFKKILDNNLFQHLVTLLLGLKILFYFWCSQLKQKSFIFLAPGADGLFSLTTRCKSQWSLLRTWHCFGSKGRRYCWQRPPEIETSVFAPNARSGHCSSSGCSMSEPDNESIIQFDLLIFDIIKGRKGANWYLSIWHNYYYALGVNIFAPWHRIELKGNL